jgi:hypothetical protein
MNKEKDIAIKFAEFIAKYGICQSTIGTSGKIRKGYWWFNQLDGSNPEKSSGELFDIAVKRKFK